MINKKKYCELCKTELTIPIFSKDWWLDAVCGEDKWDVVVVEKNGKIVASCPYFINKKYGFSMITMPQFTQNMGIWINYPDRQKYSKKLAYEKEVFTELIQKLPQVDKFNQNLHYSITNWLPFYWAGFQQTTSYTYVIENLTSLDAVFEKFDHAKRKNIKKAEQIVTVNYDLTAEQFYKNHKMTLAKQGQKISYSFQLFKNIYDAGYNNNSAKTIYAVDKDNNIHGALFVIWDDMSAYDLISTIDPEFRNSGAASLLIREVIKFISQKTHKFDFEGSMIENVQNSFRQFGAIQKPYFTISKSSRKFRICQAIRELGKDLMGRA